MTVWGRLGKLLRREGTNHRVSEIFYRALAQAVLHFCLETWKVLAEMESKVEVTHPGFLGQITGKRARRIADRTWETLRAKLVQEAVEIQSEMTYIRRQQGTMAQWVALQLIFEVCTGDKGCDGLWHRRNTWWC